MAINSRYITLRDINSGRKPDGSMDMDIVEIMAQENPVLQDIPWRECSKGREDVTTIRSGMPKATLRMFYEGVIGSKSTKKQVTNSCCTVSTALEIDMRQYKQTKDKEAYLADERRAHADVVGQGIARLLWYGDTKDDPRGINGIFRTQCEYAPSSATDDKLASFYVLNGGASSGNLRSISLVGWNPKSIHGLYPQGTSMGLDVGELKDSYVDQVGPDGTTGRLLMGIQEMNWDAGLAIRDHRYIGRICNIDIASAFNSSGVPDYTEMLRRLVCRVKSEGVNQRLYMCRMMFEALSVQFGRLTQANAVKYQDLQQKIEPSLLGIPVSFNDALNCDEVAVPQAS